MVKLLQLLPIVAILIAVPLIASCGESASTIPVTTTSQTTTAPTVTNTPTTIVIPTTTALPTTTTPETTTLTTTIPLATTAGELADFGGKVYDNECVADMCHEKWNEGGKTLFTAANLSFFGNAEKLFLFSSNFMHGGDPASVISDTAYLQVIAFILVENNLVQLGEPLSESKLASVTLYLPPTTTAGELADFGGKVYDNECVGVYCHTDWGSGGNEYFTTDTLSFFGNAEKLFLFSSNFMHGGEPTAVLSDMKYLQVIAFILVENNLVQPEDLLGESNLAALSLK